MSLRTRKKLVVSVERVPYRVPSPVYGVEVFIDEMHGPTLQFALGRSLLNISVNVVRT